MMSPCYVYYLSNNVSVLRLSTVSNDVSALRLSQYLMMSPWCIYPIIMMSPCCVYPPYLIVSALRLSQISNDVSVLRLSTVSSLVFLSGQEINVIFARCRWYFPFIYLYYVFTYYFWQKKTPFAYFSHIAYPNESPSFQRPKFTNANFARWCHVATAVYDGIQITTLGVIEWRNVHAVSWNSFRVVGHTDRHSRRHTSLLAFIKTGSWIVNCFGVGLPLCTVLKGKLKVSCL